MMKMMKKMKMKMMMMIEEKSNDRTAVKKICQGVVKQKEVE